MVAPYSRSAALIVLLIDIYGAPMMSAAANPTVSVSATTETVAVPHAEDAADDSAIWVHPTDPGKSVIIGTNKQDGLAVYALDGTQLHYYSFGKPNNVDIRRGLEVGGRPVDIAATEDRTSNTIRIFQIRPEDRSLTEISDGVLAVGYDVYGCGLYRSPRNGEFYFFVGEKETGRVDQFRLTATDTGKVTATKVRSLKVGSQTEGIVADDENGVVFIGEELRGIWRFDGEPDGATTGVLISEIGPDNPIKKDDLEGLTIYKTEAEKGYLLASSQGSNEFAVFDREAPHNHLGTFRIGDGAVDAVGETDGIEVSSSNLGAGFETGLFVAQDGTNPGGYQNFKLVPWSAISKALNLKSSGQKTK